LHCTVAVPPNGSFPSPITPAPKLSTLRRQTCSAWVACSATAHSAVLAHWFITNTTALQNIEHFRVEEKYLLNEYTSYLKCKNLI
jgi:hypothetical protein